MYKKYATFMVICNLILIIATGNVLGLKINRVAATEAFRMQMQENHVEESSFLGLMTTAASGQRIIDVNVISKEYCYELSEDDYENLLQIVEAEAGGEDHKGKMLVASVVLNRVESDVFPNTVTEVIFQKDKGVSQFSPISDGRFYEVKVSEDTVEAVEDVLCGEDVSQGALYFAARKQADPSRMKWFDQHLTSLFSYGHHEFFF